MKQKKFFIIVIILVGIILLPKEVLAVLQANPNTNGAKTDIEKNWMSNIRNMETANQAMGLEETIDKTTKNATSSSNGIDVHMIKTTEWGTVAILSASGYGNIMPVHSSTIKSTTGNKTGVYFPLKSEGTAGVFSGRNFFSGVDEKYYDVYTTNNDSAKVGDALGTSSTTNPRMCKMA